MQYFGCNLAVCLTAKILYGATTQKTTQYTVEQTLVNYVFIEITDNNKEAIATKHKIKAKEIFIHMSCMDLVTK
jgi:hypothetical protein